jgi:hypothetical protein
MAMAISFGIGLTPILAVNQLKAHFQVSGVSVQVSALEFLTPDT